jgi:hypothetical protein
MYEGSEPMWHVQVYIFTPSPFEEFLKSRRSMHPLLQDTPSTLEFVMLLVKVTWWLVRAITNSWMEQSKLTFLNELVDLPTSMWSMYQIQGTSRSRSKWTLPLCSPRNWTPLWRKWNSSKRSIRRQWRPSESWSATVPMTCKRFPRNKQKSSLPLHHLTRWLPMHL